ncbi:hypothetical protein [Streptomyces noursei]
MTSAQQLAAALAVAADAQAVPVPAGFGAGPLGGDGCSCCCEGWSSPSRAWRPRWWITAARWLAR